MDFEAAIGLVALAMAGGIGLMLAYFGRMIQAYLTLRYTAQELDIAKETAMMVVSTLKQSPAWEHLAPEKKKELAMVWISQRLERYGIAMEPVDIDRLIEKAVLIIKNSLVESFELTGVSTDTALLDDTYTNTGESI